MDLKVVIGFSEQETREKNWFGGAVTESKGK